MVQKIKYIILILLLIVTLLSFLYFIHILFSNAWLEYIKVDYNPCSCRCFQSLYIISHHYMGRILRCQEFVGTKV